MSDYIRTTQSVRAPRISLTTAATLEHPLDPLFLPDDVERELYLYQALIPFGRGAISLHVGPDYFNLLGGDPEEREELRSEDTALRFRAEPSPPPSRPPQDVPEPEGLLIPRKRFPAQDRGSFEDALRQQGVDPAMAGAIGRALEARFDQWALDEEANYRAIEIWSKRVLTTGDLDPEPEP